MHSNRRGSDLTQRELRHFGLTFAALLVGLFGVAAPWMLSHSWPTWPWVLGACAAGLALVLPNALRGPYDAWQRLGHLLGRVSSSIILTLLFVVVLTPVGLVLRVFGRHGLGRRTAPTPSTYFEASELRDIKHMERPF